MMLDHVKTAGSAAIPLRLIVEFGFIEQGYAKLLKGSDAFASILHVLGIPGALAKTTNPRAL